MIAGPREMRTICTRVSYSVCVFLDVRLVAQFARAECVLIITYVMSARAFHARFNLASDCDARDAVWMLSMREA